MKYLLNWNDEYLDMRIAGGPFPDSASAQTAMKETVIESLVTLDCAKTREEAETLYAEAEKTGELEETEVSIHVTEESASILYKGQYEDRCRIVEYTPGSYNLAEIEAD